jgi:hypothetical protein
MKKLAEIMEEEQQVNRLNEQNQQQSTSLANAETSHHSGASKAILSHP